MSQYSSTLRNIDELIIKMGDETLTIPGAQVVSAIFEPWFNYEDMGPFPYSVNNMRGAIQEYIVNIQLRVPRFVIQQATNDASLPTATPELDDGEIIEGEIVE